MKIKIFTILPIIIICISCSKEPKNNANFDFPWQEIKIENSTQILEIEKYSDSALLKNFLYKQTGGFHYKLDRVEEQVLIFSNKERDSLFKYVFETIKRPLNIEHFCTDYVGNIRFEITGDNYRFSNKYSSICSWDTISPETSKIYELINKKARFDNK